ncbi:hypothetical protein ACFL3S_04260 [Gemmatimonadota bacterium]
MTLCAVIICLLFAALGALGVVSPSRLIGIIRRFQTPRGLYFVAVLRVFLGVALLFSAPASRAPGLIFVAGVVIVMKGVITPFIGVERFRRLLDRWSVQGSAFLRGWALLTLALGLGLAYAIAP